MQTIRLISILIASQLVYVSALPAVQNVRAQSWTGSDIDLEKSPITGVGDGQLVQTRGGNHVLHHARQDTVFPASVTTITGPGLTINTVTITSLPSQQSPTSTSDGVLSGTTGSVVTSLETDGHVSSLPFPTTVPTNTESTLQPLNATAPFLNATMTAQDVTVTQTLTLPVTTFETILVTSTVTNVPVPTTVTFTQITVINSTFTSGGNTLTTSSVGTIVVTTNATALSPITLTATSTSTGTLSTTLTGGPELSTIATPSPSCVFNIGCSGQNVFAPIALGAPPANISQRGGHPVPRLGITDPGGPIETNKFYANFFLGTQGSPVYVMPYSLTWSKGTGNAQSWGMAVSQLDGSEKVFGPPNTKIPGSPSSFYINPLGIQSLILSAAELGSNTVLRTNSLAVFSANAVLQPGASSSSSITFPLVQGMAFVTGLYNNLQPAIQSSVFFRSVASAANPKLGVYKYIIQLENGKEWLLYATSANGLAPNFKLVSSTLLQGVPNWSGVIQVAKLPSPSAVALFDNACGLYPTAGAIAGYALDNQGQYSFSWTKGGTYAKNGTLLMFALPHHVQSFTSATCRSLTSLELTTNTKGNATAVVADYWSLTENELPTSMSFAPWRQGYSSVTTLSSAAIDAIQEVAAVEASQNIQQQSNLDSMYYSGKALAKFAAIAYTMNDLSNQKALAAAVLAQLKLAFSRFASNTQQYPLLYDTDRKGIVSSASYVTGDSGVDFGNSYYNDHHFHYGYFIYAAAVIGYLDPTWLVDNKDYVNALARDVSNPSSLDQYFPIFRSFDWYNGHSWAKGLFESGDGKDEESSSEDTMFAYALKMWGRTVGDKSMEARGNLMLAVLARSLQNYFLLQSDNTNQPGSFIGNKVTGILFENKVDHTTYFGNNIEYIQGIHMLPLMPFSTYTRTTNFVMEEWVTYFADGAVDPAANVQGGWKGILYANLAIINPTASYNFFTQPNFDASWLDGGASRTWYIALAAGLGGA